MSKKFNPDKQVRQAIKDASFGKKVGGGLYFIAEFENQMPEAIQKVVKLAQQTVAEKLGSRFTPYEIAYNVIKVTPQGNVSLLMYPKFIEDPHPALAWSISCSKNGTVKRVVYKQDNPWILHRKELFLPEGARHRVRFEELTRQEEEMGLLKNPPGQRVPWEALLESQGISINDHALVKE